MIIRERFVIICLLGKIIKCSCVAKPIFILSLVKLSPSGPGTRICICSWHLSDWCSFRFLLYFRFPIWPYAKLIFACWLVLPHFNGAAYVYRHFIRPFYMNPHSTTMWYVPRKGLFHKQDDVLTAAEKYMEEHGTEAFERLISKVCRLLHDEILFLGLARPDPLV